MSDFAMILFSALRPADWPGDLTGLLLKGNGCYFPSAVASGTQFTSGWFRVSEPKGICWRFPFSLICPWLAQ